eukprot:2057183-Rhodomonas_salina.1
MDCQDMQANELHARFAGQPSLPLGMPLGGLFGGGKKTKMLEELKETTDQILENTNKLVREDERLEDELQG